MFTDTEVEGMGVHGLKQSRKDFIKNICSYNGTTATQLRVANTVTIILLYECCMDEAV